MDALIYTAMSGAERVLNAQQVHANNLANADTPGFRANLERSTARAVSGVGYDARHLAQLETERLSGKAGAQRETGRALDVAVSGEGFFAVQTPSGEAYTRGGNFDVDGEGRLLSGSYPVLGEGGPITLPPGSSVQVGADGVISMLPPGGNQLQQVDKLKLVKASYADLQKNPQGLLVARNGQPLASDDSVRVAGGRLEGSNVSAVEEMVATMGLSRDFEIQMRLYKAADSMADAGNRLIRE